MSANLLEYIRDSELGANLCSQTPFGTRALIYADYTAWEFVSVFWRAPRTLSPVH